MSGNGPTLAGYTSFIYNQMGVPTSALPTDSQYIPTTYGISLQTVYIGLASFCGPGGQPPYTGPSLYALAVYNLAGSSLINFAQDPPGSPDVEGSEPPMPYFQYYRDKWDLLAPISGVVSSAADQSTSTSLEVIDQLKNLTLNDLRLMKDPFGRQYLNIMSRTGYNVGIN